MASYSQLEDIVKNITTKTINNICIAGTSSGDGKTIVTLALLRALKKRGLKIQPFKCGPDYIDGVFHKHGCDQISINLDTKMMGVNAVRESFFYHCKNKDVAVIEGVMGLYDSAKIGSLAGSTAEVAISNSSKVILVVNARGMASSIAAIVKGYCELNSEISIIGVIANKVGSDYHAKLLKEALEFYNLAPLLGYLNRDDELILPERHLGLVPFFENNCHEEWFDYLGEKAEENFDIDKILTLSQQQINFSNFNHLIPKVKPLNKKLRIAYALDEAFNFYYEDNLRFLRKLGIELVPFSPLHDSILPHNINGLYFGGGFPEMFVEKLAQNNIIKAEIKKFSELKNCFIYAECGGYMYLTNSIKDNNGHVYKMCGIINSQAIMNNQRKALGYKQVELIQARREFENMAFNGHEFHWSSIKEQLYSDRLWNMTTMRDGSQSITGYCDFKNKIFASYIHLHFSSNLPFLKKILAKID